MQFIVENNNNKASKCDYKFPITIIFVQLTVF